MCVNLLHRPKGDSAAKLAFVGPCFEMPLNPLLPILIFLDLRESAFIVGDFQLLAN